MITLPSPSFRRPILDKRPRASLGSPVALLATAKTSWPSPGEGRRERLGKVTAGAVKGDGSLPRQASLVRCFSVLKGPRGRARLSGPKPL